MITAELSTGFSPELFEKMIFNQTPEALSNNPCAVSVGVS
jgi:hypothetical protein